MRAAPFATTLLFAMTVFVAPVGAQDRGAFAQQRFTQGYELFVARRYADALAEFRASIELYGSPNSRLYVARCLRELGDLPEAVAEFARTQAEAQERASRDTRYAQTAQTARDELALLEPRIARLTVTAPGAPATAHLVVAGREVPAAAQGISLPVAPGRVEVQLSAAGFATASRVVELRAGERAAVGLALRPVRSEDALAFSRRPPDGAWVGTFVALGVAGVGAIAWGTFALLANGQYQSLCPMATVCDARYDGAIDAGRTYQALTNTGLGVAIAGGAVALVLFAVHALETPHRTRVARAVAGWSF